jgi:hypothetical protein
VFFFRDRLIASHVGGAKAPSSTELKNGLPSALANVENGEGSVEVGERTRAIASRVRGDAAHAQVGYIIGRKGSSVGLGGLFANTFKEDVASLPWLVVIGIPLLLLLLGLGLLYVEHDKGVVMLRKTSESLVKGELDCLPEGELRRHYRKIAESLNTALRAGVGFKKDAAKRASVDLDHILSSTRDSSDAGYFGVSTEAPTAKQVALESAPVDLKDSMPSASPQGVPTARPEEAATARPPRSASSRPKRSPSSWPNRAPSSRHQAVATVRHSDEQLTPAPDDPPTRPNANLDDYDGYDHPEESTQVKHVPQELLEASASAAQGEETHFREVFEQFVATQKECGGPVSGLTFEKFVRKLHAARDQVMKRHNVPSVRFTVYVKEGRAALKASPVKQ